MKNVMEHFFVDVHLSKAEQTVFLDVNCFLIASTFSEDSLWQILLRVLGDGSSCLLCNALYARYSFRFDIVFDGI